MNLLLDTHFLLWTVLDSPRLKEFSWLEAYRPWGVSPVSFLEIQFLAEVGRLEVRQPEFSRAVAEDPRFVVDEAPLVSLVEKALALSWTRDPFDRLLAAHSEARRVSLCSLDRRIRDHHRLMARELREEGL
ncbi:MAG: type II toxin-antitoxin system VapC family toxin [Gemmatimonadota bacterium]